MRKALLTGIAALFLATGTAHLAIAASAIDQPPKMKFEIDCSNDDQVRKLICGLSSAILNKDCSSMTGGEAKSVCDSVVNTAVRTEKGTAVRGEKGFDEYYQLIYICGSDWVPIVAKECARRSVGLSTEYKKKLADYLSAKRAYRWAQKAIDLENASDKFISCARNQVANLIVNNETANAIASAAITLCRGCYSFRLTLLSRIGRL
jgi:hypothetical protein